MPRLVRPRVEALILLLAACGKTRADDSECAPRYTQSQAWADSQEEGLAAASKDFDRVCRKTAEGPLLPCKTVPYAHSCAPNPDGGPHATWHCTVHSVIRCTEPSSP